MLKIGDFARICQVSIKALRHYDALGLLRPSQIDPESGYRYYEMAQLADVVHIQALKDCGFALEEIGQLLQRNDTPAIAQLLRQRMIAQQQHVAEEQNRLQRLTARLQQLTLTESHPFFDVALKQTEPITLVGRRKYITVTEEIGPCARSLLAELDAQCIAFHRPLIHLYYSLDDDEQAYQFDMFVGAPVSALPASTGDLTCERLPGDVPVACVIYRGDYPGIGAAYDALEQWIAASGYRTDRPFREIYHISPAHTDDPDTYLTEIQIPIVARGAAS